MALFKNPYDSHAHSMQVFNLLREYDTFLESLSVIADMGCGAGLDTQWFATLETRDDVPEPMNYTVYAVDRNIDNIMPDVKKLPNVVPIEGDFEQRLIPRQVDLMWAHDVFQSIQDPWNTLKVWKQTMSHNGMLLLAIPQTTYYDYTRKKLIVDCHSHQYYSYNLLTLTYMLASSGFDCRDAYFFRETNTPWLYAGVYASEHEPLGKGASWHDLADRQLINDSLINSVQKHGHARLEDVIVSWFDRDNYFILD